MRPEIYLLASASAAFVLGWWIGRAILCRGFNREIERMAHDHNGRLISACMRAKHDGVLAERLAATWRAREHDCLPGEELGYDGEPRKRSQLHNAT